MLFAFLFSVSAVVHGYVVFSYVKHQSPIPNIEFLLTVAKHEDEHSESKVFSNHTLEGGGSSEKGTRTSTPNTTPKNKRSNEQEDIAHLEGLLAKKIQQMNQTYTAEPVRAAIEKEWNAYQARPRKHFEGPNTTYHEATSYILEWLQHVETWSNQQVLPVQEAQVVVTVEVYKTGKVLLAHVEKSSGYSNVDQLAIKAFLHGARPPPFPTSISDRMDIIVVTRTWKVTANNNTVLINPID